MNNVYFCQGEFRGAPIRAYMKVGTHQKSSLANEGAILAELQNTTVPIPLVVWYGKDENEVLILEEIKGHPLSTHLDANSKLYDRESALRHLRASGRWLAQIHDLPISWQNQKRSNLQGLIGEEEVHDVMFQRIVSWLMAEEQDAADNVFLHGDFNPSNILLHDGSISGILDWEFAGAGWREYELAWALKSVTFYSDSLEHREAFLAGYSQGTSYSEERLRWCEVLNYLHTAFWLRKTQPADALSACERAMSIAGLSKSEPTTH